MRCLSCDRILTESEDARKFEGSGQRVGLCNRCVVWVPVTMVGGEDVVVEDMEEVPLEEMEDEDGGDGLED